jgi:Na+-transporting NADH:ubiquinone oxidoreductase subunit A
VSDLICQLRSFSLFFKLKKGLDIPLKGRPDERIEVASDMQTVAVLGADYIGLKPTMRVQVGDQVKAGTPLFEDKKNPGVIVTSPAAGSVRAINRGSKRALLSVEIDVDGYESESFPATLESDLSSLSEQDVRDALQKSGQWVSFRTRPYGKVPTINSSANSIFVNAMDTNPLAVDPQFIIKQHAAEFANGLVVLNQFKVPVYVCKANNAKLPNLSANTNVVNFAGPHPAGLSSTHVHCVDPVNANKVAWTLDYQDVIAIGNLFVNGQVYTRRYIALGGPLVTSPRVLDSRLGVCVSALVAGKTTEGTARIISGSVLNGHTAYGTVDFLGRYNNQITVIEEHTDREFMGYLSPGVRKFSALRVFVSGFFKPKSYHITTSQYGSPRAIVPVGAFEKVVPLDILPTPLIKSLLVNDVDEAQKLGCLELVEEDLSLCSFVDPGKHDFAPLLRATLTQIEKEG